MRVGASAGAVVAALVLSGCGGGPSPMPTVDDVPTAADEPAEGLQVRPVLGMLAELDCELSDDPPLPGNEPAGDEVALCGVDGIGYRLGPAVTGGDPVAAASAVELREGWRIEIELAPGDREAVAALAESAASSDSQIALVVDGLVLSAPTVAGTIGGTLQLAGSWTDEQAQEYADRLTP